MNMPNPVAVYEKIETIIDILEHVQRVYDGLAGGPDDRSRKDALTLLKLLTRMAEGENVSFDMTEFGRQLPRSSPNWKVRYAGPHAKMSFVVRFEPEADFGHLGGEINVNLSLLEQRLAPVVVVSGRDVAEIGLQTPKNVFSWMKRKEDDLTMAYGKRTRQQIGR